MYAHLFRYSCLTNLHVGSGEANYNIIDNEAERDPVTGDPIIHASGVKGALREFFAEKLDPSVVQSVFGAPPAKKTDITSGKYKFLDAHLIARPMRVSNSAVTASVLVTTLGAVNRYLQLLSVLGLEKCCGVRAVQAEHSAFGDAEFLTNTVEPITVEGEKTAKMPAELVEQLTKLSNLLGETFALARSFGDYPLPVVARNQLKDRISQNLWYEEIVPHGSVFYQIILTPDENMELPLDKQLIQFGGNASIGCGYVFIESLASSEVGHE